MPNNKHLDTPALAAIVLEILQQGPNYFIEIVKALHKRTGNWYESKTRYILEALVDTGEITFVNRNDFSPTDKVWRKVFSINNRTELRLLSNKPRDGAHDVVK